MNIYFLKNKLIKLKRQTRTKFGMLEDKTVHVFALLLFKNYKLLSEVLKTSCVTVFSTEN